MDLHYIKNIGKHKLHIDQKTLTLVLEKEYELSSKGILEHLKNNSHLTHVPHILSFELNETKGKLVSLEEYIEGQSLRNILDECGYITETNINLYFSNLLNTLIELHKHDLLHKDIKPENIIINEHGAHLIDFDISREYNNQKENDTNLLGTKGYASPEQFGFAQTTTKSDIYSLGVTLKEMLEICILEPKKYDYFESLAEQMTNIDSEKRPTAFDIYQSLQEENLKDKSTAKMSENDTESANVKSDLDDNSKLNLIYLIPFILTGKGLISNLIANSIVIYFIITAAFDPAYYNYIFKPIPAIFCLLITLSAMNSFVNSVTKPYYKKSRQNIGVFKRIGLWWGLRLGDYLVANLLFALSYETISAITF